MAMWVLGAVFTGASQNYGSLMFARVFMGAGAPGRALPPAGAAAVSRRCARAPHAEGRGLAERGAGGAAGEASLMTLSGPFVDDVAPPKQKAFWFSLLSLFPSVGVAAGARPLAPCPGLCRRRATLGAARAPAPPAPAPPAAGPAAPRAASSRPRRRAAVCRQLCEARACRGSES